MRIITTFLFCLYSLFGFAQYVINTQADIDAFCSINPLPTNILLQPSCPVAINLAPMNPCISMVTSITFQGSCIVDISALTNITSLNQLVINNTKLTNLAGLQNLATIPSSPRKLTIRDNTCLNDISALATNLFSGSCSSGGGEILGELVLINNDLLDDNDMDVFQNSVCGIGTSLRIESMDGIQCLDQFANLSSIPILSITDNSSLVKVDFCSLQNMNHPLITSTIKNNILLEDLNSFKNICSISTGLSICDNTSILNDGCDQICTALSVPGCDITNVSFVNNGGDCFGTCAAILPVELISFEARKQNEMVVLDWATNSEINNHYFEIEHSIDGSNFKTIGMEEGNGTSLLTNNYSFLHESPKSGTNFYRLKQIDFDGAFEFSDVTSVRTKEVRELTLFPNPVQNELTISMKEEVSEDVSIEILDVSGKIVLKYNLVAGSSQYTFNTADMINGNYVLKIQGNNIQHSKRFVKI